MGDDDGLLTLKEMKQLWLSRDAIMKWMQAPEFLAAMRGLYCRVVMRDADAQKRYRIAKVEQVIFPEKGNDDKPVIDLTQGKHTRSYPLHFVSNSPFTEDELDYFYETLEKAGLQPITKADVRPKLVWLRDFLRSKKQAQEDGRDAAASRRSPPRRHADETALPDAEMDDSRHDDAPRSRDRDRLREGQGKGRDERHHRSSRDAERDRDRDADSRDDRDPRDSRDRHRAPEQRGRDAAHDRDRERGMEVDREEGGRQEADRDRERDRREGESASTRRRRRDDGDDRRGGGGRGEEEEGRGGAAAGVPPPHDGSVFRELKRACVEAAPAGIPAASLPTAVPPLPMAPVQMEQPVPAEAQRPVGAAGGCGRCVLKDSQVDNMRYELDRLEKDLSHKQADVKVLEACLSKERSGQKAFKVKLREMDVVIQQQAEVIKAQAQQLQDQHEITVALAHKRTLLAKKCSELQGKSDGAVDIDA